MTFHDEIDGLSDLDKAHWLQDGMLDIATGVNFPGGNPTYVELRRHFVSNAALNDKVPSFLRRCRSLDQFWQYIKYEYGTYAERRKYLWSKFAPLMEYLEAQDRSPSAPEITAAIKSFDPDALPREWQKALDRRAADPEGAITAARTLLEATCKHLLDEMDIEYTGKENLPKLWSLCAGRLNLAPSQHEEEAFKAILGNCQSIVGRLSNIRNLIGDAHGKGRKAVKPKPRHAELVVNLAGTMASFILATYLERK